MLHQLNRRPGRPRVTCLDFARTLVASLDQAGADLRQRTINVLFNPNHYDSHVVVELVDPATQTPFVLDPTFMLAIERASDGGWMSPEEVSTSVQQHRFDEIAYRFLDPFGEDLTHGYYMDYPLLFLNILRNPTQEFHPVTPYLTEVSLPLPGTLAHRIIQCTQGESVLVKLDGVETLVTCDGVESTARALRFRTIEPVDDPSSFRVFEMNRYQF